MTRRDTEIKVIRDQTSYEPMGHGKFSGQPTVSVKLSSAESNSIKVVSLESLFQRYGWKRKLRSGDARLRIYGDNPFSEEHSEALDFLFDLLNPRFIDFEVKDIHIQEEPIRSIRRRADTFSFVFDVTKEDERFDPEVMKNLSDFCNSHGNAQYIFKSDSVSQEDDIKEFKRKYGVYDWDVWLYPKGEKQSTVSESRESIETVAKRNTWCLSPRMDIISDG
jgi:hypothetical protein